MRTFPISPPTPNTLFFAFFPVAVTVGDRIRSPCSTSSSSLAFVAAAAASSHKLFSYKFRYSNEDCVSFRGDDDGDGETEVEKLENNGVEDVEIEKLGNNSRRIRSKIVIDDASLQTVWSILTDYEGLADFIPGLAVSQIVEKGEKFARLFQVGEQNLAFGLKFNAKGIVNCYEKDLESLPSGKKRDIEFKMIDGDFRIFEGKWSIEQHDTNTWEGNDTSMGQKFYTTLTYLVDVEPKGWLPVYLVEGRLSREIKMNLTCIREEAKKRTQNSLSAH